MKRTLRAILVSLAFAPSWTMAFFGPTRGVEDTVLNFSKKAHYEASALAIKIGQKITSEIKDASHGDRHQLIVTLLVCEPFISSLHELLVNTERSLFRDAQVRYSAGSLVGELEFLLEKITEIKRQLPERERDMLREIQHQQHALAQFPGIAHPQYPTSAAVIEAAPKVMVVGFIGVAALVLVASVRGRSKEKLTDTVTGINDDFRKLREELNKGLQELHGKVQEGQKSLSENAELLLQLAEQLTTADNYNKLHKKQVDNVVDAIKETIGALSDLKKKVPQLEGGTSLFSGLRRSRSGSLSNNSRSNSLEDVAANLGTSGGGFSRNRSGSDGTLLSRPLLNRSRTVSGGSEGLQSTLSLLHTHHGESTPDLGSRRGSAASNSDSGTPRSGTPRGWGLLRGKLSKKEGQ